MEWSSPKPVNVARGNEKGRVERAISYIRTSFFEARQYRDSEDLNEQALEWCDGLAAGRRCAEDRGMTVAQAFELEKPSLLKAPDNPFPAYEKDAVRVGKTPYIRWDLNDYSAPHYLARKTVQVVADLETVKILDGLKEVACHKRSWDKGRQIEDPAHIEALKEQKTESKQHRGMDRLHHAAPTAQKLFMIAAEEGQNLGGATTQLLNLLDLYGSAELELAIQEALEAKAANASSVRQILERRRREQNLPVPVAIAVPADPRIQNLVVVPHKLSDYDAIHKTQETGINE